MSMLVEMGSVVENNILSDDVRAMVIQAPQVAAQAEPGQFVMVKNESGSTFLRRPFGVADVDREQGRLLLIYRVAGKGTRELAVMLVMLVLRLLVPGSREAGHCLSAVA